MYDTRLLAKGTSLLNEGQSTYQDAQIPPRCGKLRFQSGPSGKCGARVGETPVNWGIGGCFGNPHALLTACCGTRMEDLRAKASTNARRVRGVAVYACAVARIACRYISAICVMTSGEGTFAY